MWRGVVGTKIFCSENRRAPRRIGRAALRKLFFQERLSRGPVATDNMFLLFSADGVANLLHS